MTWEPFGDLAHGRAAQSAGAGGVLEGGFDVACAQRAREHLHGQALQLGRPAGQPGAHPRDERLGTIGHRRNAERYGPVRRRLRRYPVQ